MKLDAQRIKGSAAKALRQLYMALPILLGVILLISMANALIPKSAYAALFGESELLNSFIGAGIGSVLAGNPVTSYVIGGEFLDQGISLMAVTAFLIAWVTVGIVQLPAESMLLGKRFAITRNIASFILSIVTAALVVIVIGLGGLL
ncbi:MAG: hypothetical protein R6U32_04155 [Candidatus Woesearchaeota archaeon]